MAKHTGITIRIGAAYDQVIVGRDGNKLLNDIVFDRSQMRKDGKPELQGGLRRAVVDTWAEQRNANKAKRGDRRQRGAVKDRARREHA